MSKHLEDVLQALYDSEINVRIEWCWDGGFDVGFGGEKCASFEHADLIAEFLISSAKSLYPDSKFTREWKD
jgi:hypothetical protein